MSDWQRVPIGTLGKTYAGLSGKRGDDFGEGSPYIPYMNVFSSARIDPSRVDRVRIEVGERQNRIQCGDIFFTTSSETVEDVGTSSVLTEDMEDTYLNSFCFGFRLHSFDQLLPEFAAYLLRGQQCRKAISDLGQGSTRYNLPKTILLQRLSLHLPPLPEQRKIASILTTVDSLIEQTEALIEKYRRVKQGMMADLLSRGVDAHGKLRPTQQQAPELYKQSELGWIPKEWDVVAIGAVAESLVDGPFGSNLKTEHYVDQEGVRVVRLQNIDSEGYHDSDKAFVSQKHASMLARNKVIGGDVLIAGLGDESNLVGRCCLYPNELPPAINKADCFRLRCSTTSMVNGFAVVVLNSNLLQPQLREVSQGVTRIRVNTGNMKKIVVPVPAVSEQLSICSRLNSIGDNIDAQLRVRAKLLIQKTGLMQDLLTGKVRVKVDEAEEVTADV